MSEKFWLKCVCMLCFNNAFQVHGKQGVVFLSGTVDFSEMLFNGACLYSIAGPQAWGLCLITGHALSVF